MAIYTIQTTVAANAAGLHNTLIAADIPVQTILGYPDRVEIYTTRDLTPAEVTTMEGIVAAHDPRPWRPRRLLDIYTDITALSGANQTAIWTDLTSGSPPRWATDVGPNAAALFALQFLATAVAGLTTAERNEARRRVAAFYVGDNPKYLVNPAFAPAINVNGEEQFTP